MPQRPARSANPYSGMTDDELLAKVQQIRSMAASEAESSVTGRSHQGPALDRFPEAIPQHRAPAANVSQPPPVNQQPYVQAEMLTEEARPPVPATGWRGIGEAVMKGLASTGHPGGYHGYAADQQQVERQRQQDLLSRAQQLRSEGMAREQMNVAADRFNLTQSQTAEQNRIENEQRNRQLDIQGRNKFASGAQGVYNVETGEVTTPATTKPENLTNLSRATVLYRGQPTDVLEDLDPSSPSKGRVFVRTEQGLQDVTGQTQHYEAPSKYPEPVYWIRTRDPQGREIQVPVSREDALNMSQGGGNFPAANPSAPGEKRAMDFYLQAEEAAKTLDDPKMQEWIRQLNLMGQGRLSLAPNVLQSAEGKIYDNAIRAFTEARLRKVSGAQIRPDEYEYTRNTYFGRPGDTPDVIANKQRLRDAVLTGIRQEAGRAYSEHYGERPSPTTPNTADTTNTGQRVRVRNRETGKEGTISEAALKAYPDKYERLP